MKYLIGWAIIATAMSIFWGLAALAVLRDVGSAIIIGVFMFFVSFLLAGLAASGAREIDGGR